MQLALRNQTLHADDISAVLLVGGSTAIPLVHRLLAAEFGEAKLKRDINPMECVALGAALHADRFDVQAAASATKATGTIQRVTTMHFGIAALNGDDSDAFVPIIEKGTPYPLDKPRSRIFHPGATNQKLLRVPVYEGLSPKASLNALQGIVEWPLPTGINTSQGIEVTFDYDANRVLTVQLKLVGTDKSYTAEIRRAPPRPRRAAAPASGDSLQDDWREGLSATIRMGRIFEQGYGLYMADADREALKAAIAKAEAAINAEDEREGKQAGVIIESKVASSGLASLIYMAERVLQRASASQARVLAQALAALRQAHAQGRADQVEQLTQTIRASIAEILAPHSEMSPERLREDALRADGSIGAMFDGATLAPRARLSAAPRPPPPATAPAIPEPPAPAPVPSAEFPLSPPLVSTVAPPPTPVVPVRPDPVDCSVFAPVSVRGGMRFVLQAFLHAPSAPAAAAALTLAAQVDPDLSIEIARGEARQVTRSLDAPVRRDAKVDIFIEPDGLLIDDNSAGRLALVWRGEPIGKSVLLKAPRLSLRRTYFPVVRFFVDGAPIGRVRVKISRRAWGAADARPCASPWSPTGRPFCPTAGGPRRGAEAGTGPARCEHRHLSGRAVARSG